MREAYVEINGVRTKISTWGRWIEEAKKDDEPNEMVLIIPGNPGVNGFYHLFAKTIHELTGFPVWIVGHAGHNIPNKSDIHLPKFKENKDLYGLKGQIEHKVDFIKKYIPQGTRLHLIGHSIGSYTILELLDHPDVTNKIHKVYLLFPAIEHMADTSHGKFLIHFIRPILRLILFLTWIFTLLPSLLATLLLYIYMYITGLPAKIHHDNIKELLKPAVLRRVFYLAVEEISSVRERNNAVIRRNKDRIRFYYGNSDKWTPKRFYESLRNDVDGVDVLITSVNHSFVFNKSVEVGETVSSWLLNEVNAN